MNNTNTSALVRGMDLVSQVLAEKDLSVEETIYQFKLGVEALKNPETPRLVFAEGVTLEAQIEALKAQLVLLEKRQLREMRENDYRKGMDDCFTQVDHVLRDMKDMENMGDKFLDKVYDRLFDRKKEFGADLTASTKSVDYSSSDDARSQK